jgi:hypothetical protein
MPNPRKRFEISDRLAVERIGFLRLHAACRRPRRAHPSSGATSRRHEPDRMTGGTDHADRNPRTATR